MHDIPSSNINPLGSAGRVYDGGVARFRERGALVPPSGADEDCGTEISLNFPKLLG